MQLFWPMWVVSRLSKSRPFLGFRNPGFRDHTIVGSYILYLTEFNVNSCTGDRIVYAVLSQILEHQNTHKNRDFDSLGSECIISAGTVVVGNTADRQLVAGNPGKVIRVL